MKTRFYSHIVETDSLKVALEEIEFSPEEREHLHHLVDSNIYHAVMNTILSELSDTDKIIFLQYLSEEDHTKVWNHLNKRIENIEEKIKNAAEELKAELHEDITESKRKHS